MYSLNFYGDMLYPFTVGHRKQSVHVFEGVEGYEELLFYTYFTLITSNQV